MINVAVVEDELLSAQSLEQYIAKYQQQSGGETFKVTHFSNGLDFLDTFKKGNFDIVLMDIEMPGLNGIQAAKNMRLTDEYVTLMFVTNMAQYALSGYEVGAIDFVVKPLSYLNFAMKFEKAVRNSQKHKRNMIFIPSVSGNIRVSYADVYYIESDKHYLMYHTTKGEIKMRGVMRGIEDDFVSHGFARCSNSFLVNLDYVDKFTSSIVEVCGKELPISRSKRDEFMRSLAMHLGGSVK